MRRDKANFMKKDSKLPFVILAILAESCIIYASVLVKMIDISPINIALYRVAIATPFFFLATFIFMRKDCKKNHVILSESEISKKDSKNMESSLQDFKIDSKDSKEIIKSSSQDSKDSNLSPTHRLIKTNKTTLKVPLKDFILMLFAGVFFAFDLIFFNLALKNTSVANVNLISCMSCFILIPLGVLFFGEKIKKSFFVGVFIAILGLVVLIKGKDESGVSSVYGDLLACLSALGYALFLAFIYALRRRFGTLEIMAYSTLGAAVVLFIVAVCVEGLQVPSDFRTLALLVLIAFFGQLVGQGFFNFILGKLDSQTSFLLLLVAPVIAAIMGFLILGERLSTLEICGILIIILGVYFAKKDSV